MVKLTGPALAQRASGSLGGALIFSSSRGRSYLKKSAKPKQPRTAPQVAMRAFMTFLSDQWKNLSFFDRETWNDLALQSSISPFNAYQRVNLDLLRDHLGPTTQYNAPPVGPGGGIASTQAIGGVRTALLRINLTSVGNNWAVQLYQVPSVGAPYDWNNTIHILPAFTTGWHEWRWTGLAPGTYYVRYAAFTVTGYTKRVFSGTMTPIVT